jgi:alanyl-tRNA synthetase
MSTVRIYQKDQYETSNQSLVTAVIQKDGVDVIACGESVFFPEGGGQPSDTGTVSSAKGVFDITHAYDEDLESDVWHVTDAPAGTFETGDEVVLTIDWDSRFSNMQRHLGEHMLSGTFDSLFGGVNRGFHMGEDYITIDIDLDGRMLTDEELDLAERTVNEAIWADLPVTVSWFDDYESSLVMPVRKQVPHDGRVSVVTVGDPDDPYDCIACCGTHPARSSEVGLLAVYKCDPNKGMNRIFFDCGIKAWHRLTADSRMLYEISKRYSCSPADLESRLDIEAETLSSLKGRIAALSSYVKEAERDRILSGLNAPGKATKTACYTTELLSVDELLKLGFSVISETSDMLLLMLHPESLTCLLFSSGDAKCGDLVKEHAPAFGGKGGGRPDNARAVFGDLKEMKAFAAKLTEC